MNRTGYIYLILASAVAATECRKPYMAPIQSVNHAYLVVEGTININGQTTIKLSRSTSLSSKTTINPLEGANVVIENSQNNSYSLTETKSGTYVSDSLNLDPTLKYRLRIKTTGGGEYLSDFVTAKTTPPIDSIGFNINGVNNSLNIYANAHDPNNNTRYYRWDYTETWQFHAKYFSGYMSNGQAIVERQPYQYIYYCFHADTSSDIVINSTAKLKQDVTYQNTIVNIPSTSEKIEVKYSILLHQYALTNDAYDFWVAMRKNTEELGSIFDVQPSKNLSNIHNVNNSSEPVIGYISACSVQTKRVFIAKQQLPQSWITTYPYDCGLDSNRYCYGLGCKNQVADNLIQLPNENIPVSAFFDPLNPAGFTSSKKECVDCTIRGTQVKPSFWQ